jgi:cobalt/nickel transport system permease protein
VAGICRLENQLDPFPPLIKIRRFLFSTDNIEAESPAAGRFGPRFNKESSQYTMHISEGVLSGTVLISGVVLAAAGTAVGLKKLDLDRIGQAGLLSAAFFVASLVHVPLGPSNVHLLLNGMVGILLGWSAFPVILVALLLQAILFQYGGITTLGINTVIMALPAVIAYYVFRTVVRLNSRAMLPAACVSGMIGVFLAGCLAAAALISASENFFETALLLAAAHLPVMIIEGIVTAFCVGFLRKMQPEMIPVENREKP